MSQLFPFPPPRQTRVWFVAALAALLMAVAPSTLRAERLAKLVLAGPPAAVSVPLIHMIDSGALNDVAAQVDFVLWKDPDQMRVLALGGKADFMAMPSNVAANLYNRGVGLRLLDISTWGALWILSRDPTLKTLADFRGKEIAVPFRADMPDIVFGLLAEKAGLDPKKDFRIRYVATPFDAMQLLITRRVDHALLAEPAVSMALRKTKSFPISVIAPDLYRSVDLQKEWGRLFQRAPSIPQAGIVALGHAASDGALQAKVMAAYAHSLGYCQKNALTCGQMVAKRIDLLTPEAVADSIAASQMRDVAASAARGELEFFFQQLQGRAPALIGGKLPDAAFFGTPGKP